MADEYYDDRRLTSEETTVDWIDHLMTPDKMPFLIPIVAILVGGVAILVNGVLKIVKLVIVHRERMAKIANGIDPDFTQSSGARRD